MSVQRLIEVDNSCQAYLIRTFNDQELVFHKITLLSGGVKMIFLKKALTEMANDKGESHCKPIYF